MTGIEVQPVEAPSAFASNSKPFQDQLGIRVCQVVPSFFLPVPPPCCCSLQSLPSSCCYLEGSKRVAVFCSTEKILYCYMQKFPL